MKKIRRRYDRDFKISVLAELESGKPLAQVAREYGIHPSLPCRWKAELSENPEKAFLLSSKKKLSDHRIMIAGWDFPEMISKGGLGKRACKILLWIVWARTAALHPPLDQKARRSAYSWHQAKSNPTQSAIVVGMENIDLIRGFMLTNPSF